MSIAQTQLVIDRYFDLMGRQADFAESYSPDVTWLIADTGEVIRGADAVRDYVVGLHAALADMRSRRLVVGDASVYLEGDCAASALERDRRVHYCVAYDVQDDVIVAIRCYGVGA